MPLYEYLYRCIRGDILDGTLAAGERLPSKRALAEHLRLSVMTVEGAYQQLEAEGYVYTLPRRGVLRGGGGAAPARAAGSAAAEAREAPDWRLDLKSNRVDASRFPVAAWSRLTRQALTEEAESLLRSVPHQGLPALRQAIARDLREYKGMAVSPEQIVVGAGAEYLYLLLAQLLGREAVFAVETRATPRSGWCTASAARPAARCPWTARAWRRRPWRRRGPQRPTCPRPTTTPPGLVTPIGRRQACCGGRSGRTLSSSRTTMTVSSASQAAPSRRCRASTPPGGWYI